ncbi:MAG: hypothetical protein AAGI51_11755 [Pseudomonadota bacterium]
MGAEQAPVLMGSITDAGEAARGRVAVCGSHGGRYAAMLASRAGLRAVILNDAGRGLDDAGVAGVLALAEVGMAAAAVDAMSARIGDGADMAARGVISTANAVAELLGVAPGMTAAEAARRMAEAPWPIETLAPMAEARRAVRVGAVEALLCDSASLLRAEDAGGILVTGSHGGLIGGDPARATKAPMRLAVFHDAGIGAEAAGVSRLPALEGLGRAGAAVAAATARIGEAASLLETGVLSRVNGPAAAMGLRDGVPLREALAGLAAG